MVRVLWLTKKPPVKAEIEAIEKIIGPHHKVEHITKHKSFASAREVIEFINRYSPDIVVPILPLSTKRWILKHRELWKNPNMIFLEPIAHDVEDTSQFNPDTDFYIGKENKAILRFDKFKILKDVVLVMEDFTWETVKESLKR